MALPPTGEPGASKPRYGGCQSEKRADVLILETERMWGRDLIRLHDRVVGWMPLLMLHGDRDAQVPIAHSEDMDSALKHAGRSHRFVTFPDTDHSFSAEKSRAAMLHEIEGFLAEHLAASPGQ
jgi:pimeloyl-ACP methyl ester carboxylesterase